MKYAIASLLATTNALTIRNSTKAGSGLTCSSNYERITSQKDLTVDSSFVTGHMVGGKFEDPSFTADESMLYDMSQWSGNGSQINGYKHVMQSPGVKWKRPSEVQHKGGFSLWGKNGISVKISEQGYDGDCWFLSAASALAAYPERIKSIFAQDAASTNGAYQLKLWVDGEPVNVLVDDRLPVYDWSYAAGYNANYPALNNDISHAGAIWLQILEKAMAKLNNNYVGINGGTPAEAMRIMTGQPTQAYQTANLSDDQVWAHITDGVENSYNMGAGCSVSHYNMISGHAYGVLDAITLTGGAHDGQKLIQMRNPWGTNHYNGPWSEKSSLWTADYRKQAHGYTTEDEGIFWISLQDWRSDYSSLSINYWHDDWKVTNHKGTDFTWGASPWSEMNAWITIDNPAEQDVALECLQNDWRLFANKDCDTAETPQDNVYFEVKRPDWTDVEGISGSSYAFCNGDSLTYKNLPAGKYQLRVVNQQNQETAKMANLKLRTFAKTAALGMTSQAGNTYM